MSRLRNDKSLTEAGGVKFVSATTTELIVKNKAAIQALVRQVTISMQLELRRLSERHLTEEISWNPLR